MPKGKCAMLCCRILGKSFGKRCRGLTGVECTVDLAKFTAEGSLTRHGYQLCMLMQLEGDW
jgi:hypothetical protein